MSRKLEPVNNRIGIMQGRLFPSASGKPQAFPEGRWEDEISLAASLGFQAMEWLLDAESADRNPLWQEARRVRAGELKRKEGVEILSLCADYVQSFPLSRQRGELLKREARRLADSVEAAAAMGVRCTLVPAMEEGLRPGSRGEEALVQGLAPALDRALNLRVKVGLEMEWPGEEQARLVERIAHPALGVYYDLGNAASQGYSPAEEIRSLDGILVGVHVKDRKIQGPSVFLGQGDTDFPSAFRALQEIGYQGPFILETPRGDDPLDAARRNLAFLRRVLNPPGYKKGAEDEGFQKHKRAI